MQRRRMPPRRTRPSRTASPTPPSPPRRQAATPRAKPRLRERDSAGRERGRALMATLRRYFVAGLLVWIPLVITLWVLKLIVDVMDQSLLLIPSHYRSEALFGFHVPGMGLILTTVIVLFTG